MSCFLFEAIFIVWFLHRPAFDSRYLHFMRKSVGGTKQAVMLKQALIIFCEGGV